MTQNFDQTEEKKHKWRRWTVLILFLAMAITGYVYARRQPQMLAEEAGTKGETVTYGASVTLRYHYALCGHDVRQEGDVRRYIGLSETEIEEEFPGFAVKKFSPEEVVLQKHYSCYCPSHILAYLEENHVVLRQCEEFGDTFVEVETIPIQVDKLSGEDKDALIAGKVFADVPAAQKFLSAYRVIPDLQD